MNLEKIETDARAKIFWGESPESVLSELQSKGLGSREALEMIEAIKKERQASIRSAGITKIIVGGLLLIVPVAAYFFFYAVRIIPLKLFGFTIAIGAYGVWKLINGTMNVFFPGAESGDLSDRD